MKWPWNAVVFVAAWWALAALVAWFRWRAVRCCPLCGKVMRAEDPTCLVIDHRNGELRPAHRYCTPAWTRPAVLPPDVWRDRRVRVAEEQDRLDALHRPHTLDARDPGYVARPSEPPNVLEHYGFFGPRVVKR